MNPYIIRADRPPFDWVDWNARWASLEAVYSSYDRGEVILLSKFVEPEEPPPAGRPCIIVTVKVAERSVPSHQVDVETKVFGGIRDGLIVHATYQGGVGRRFRSFCMKHHWAVRNGELVSGATEGQP